MLRELLLRTVDNLTLPVVKARRTSMAAAFVYPDVDPAPYLKRTAAIAQRARSGARGRSVQRRRPPRARPRRARARRRDAARCGRSRRASPGDALRAVAGRAAASARSRRSSPNTPLAVRSLHRRLGRKRTSARIPARSPYSQTAGDRLRVGYGKLTVYIGAAAGAGKTYAMLDRAHQLAGRRRRRRRSASSRRTAARKRRHCSTAWRSLPPKTFTANGITYREFDRDALIARASAGRADRRARAHQRTRIDRTQTLLRRARRPARRHRRDHDAERPASRGAGRHGRPAHRHGRPRDAARRHPVARRRGDPDRRDARDCCASACAKARSIRRIASKPRSPTSSAPRTSSRCASSRCARRCARAIASAIASPFERLLLAIGSREVDLPMITRAGRIAARLAIDFAIAHVVAPKENVDPNVVESYAPRRARPTSSGSTRRRRRSAAAARDRARAARDDDRAGRNAPSAALAARAVVRAPVARRRRSRIDLLPCPGRPEDNRRSPPAR